jgi:hypothetical protein
MTHQILKRAKSFRSVLGVALAVASATAFPLKAEQLRGFGDIYMSPADENAAVFEC